MVSIFDFGLKLFALELLLIYFIKVEGFLIDEIKVFMPNLVRERVMRLINWINF